MLTVVCFQTTRFAIRNGSVDLASSIRDDPGAGFREVKTMMLSKGKILILKLNGRILSLLIQDNRILSVQVQKSNELAVGNIYIGKVQNLSPNIDAAFVNLGQGHTAFLPLSEMKHAVVTNRTFDGKLKAEDEVLVQVAREPMKTKQAGVTANLSLSGKYVVVKANGNRESSVQVSSKLSRKQKNRFCALPQLQEIGRNCQIVVRTNAGDLEDEMPLVREAASLADQLQHILTVADKRTCYSCLYEEKPDYIHFIQSAYTAEYDEIVTDLPEIYEVLKEELSRISVSAPLRLYTDSLLPLHKLYAVDSRLRELLDKKVWLKSGGYLIIEPTEALISIDVNSGKYERGKDKEEAVFRINLEAAEMIAVQLRARNLSGMILVDFINMKDSGLEQKLMEYMRSLLRRDSIPADVIDMTGLGLMEITRKKVRPSLREQLQAN